MKHSTLILLISMLITLSHSNCKKQPADLVLVNGERSF